MRSGKSRVSSVECRVAASWRAPALATTMLRTALAAVVLLGPSVLAAAEPPAAPARPAGAASEAEADAARGRREAGLELRRRQAQLDRFKERLQCYEGELDGLMPEAPDQDRTEVCIDVRSDTDAHGRTLYALEADRATLRSVLEHLAIKARLELVLDGGVPQRHVAGLVSVALDGVTLRQALDLLLGRFDLECIVSDGQIAVVPPAQLAFRTAEQRLHHKAEQAYKAALVGFPDHEDAPRARLVLGQRFHARQLFPQAIEELQGLLRDYPRAKQAPAALWTLAQSYAALGAAAKAASAYKAIVANHPECTHAAGSLLALADGRLAAGEPREAIGLLEELLGRYPNDGARPEAELRLAEAMRATGRHSDALARLGKVLDGPMGPKAKLRARLLVGRTLAAQGHHAQARAEFYRVVQQAPDGPEGQQAYFLLADTYFGEENYLPAVEAYRGALSRCPDAPQAGAARLRLAALYHKMTLYDLAIATYEAVLRDDPGLPQRRTVLHALGECCYAKGRYSKAQLHFERAAEGQDAEAWESLLRAGQAALADERPAEAARCLEQVAHEAKDPSVVARACDALGECHRRLGRLADALVAYERAAAQHAVVKGKPKDDQAKP